METLIILWGTMANAPFLLLLLKVTLILLAALGATVMLQRASAGSRHTVWLVTLASLLLIPGVALWAPIRLAILPASFAEPADVSGRPTFMPVAPSGATPGGEASPPAVATAEGVSPGDGATSSANHVAEATTLTDRVARAFAGASGASLLMVVWLGVALSILAALVRSTMVVRRIVRRSTPLTTSDWLNPLYEVSDRLSLDEPPRIVRSPDAKMPFACGLTRPTIVLPDDCESWTTERRSAVLLHELAHVKRHDLVGHTVGRLACAIYWFHPLVWTGAKKLRAESERACDDIALACGARATDYAEHLLDIVTGVRGDRTPAVALAMARRKEFEGRMLAILDPALARSAPTRAQSFAIAGAFAAFALLTGAASPMPRDGHAAQLPADAVGEAPERDAPIPSFAGSDTDRVLRSREPVRDDDAWDAHTVQAEAHLDAADAAAIGSAVASATAAIGPTIEAAMRDVVAPTVESTVTAVVPQTINGVMQALFGQSAGGSRTGPDPDRRLGPDPDRNPDPDPIRRVGPAPDRRIGPAAPERPTDERAPVLARLLRSDTSAAVRRIAAWGLHRYPRSTVGAEALAEAVTRDGDAGVREMAAWSLASGGRSGGAAERALTSALQDSDSRVRRAAAWSLGSIDARGAASALAGALRDTSARVREVAAWSLGNISPRQAPSQLFDALRDSDRRVRRAAAWALRRIEDPRSLDPLRAALRVEEDREIRYAYVRAIGALGERSVSTLSELLESDDPELRRLVTRMLTSGKQDPWPWPWPWPRPSP